MTLFSCVRKKDSKLVKTPKYIFSKNALEELGFFMYCHMFVKKYMKLSSYYVHGGEDFTFFGYNILTGVGKGYVQSNLKRSSQVNVRYKFNVVTFLSENKDWFNLHYFLYNVVNLGHAIYETRRNVISNMLIGKKNYEPKSDSALNKSIFSLCINSFKSSHFFKNNLKDSDAKEYFQYIQKPMIDILKSIYKEIKKNKQDTTIGDILGEDGAGEVNCYYIHFYTPIKRLVYFMYLIDINGFYESSSPKTYSYLILSKLLDNKLEFFITKITIDYNIKLIMSKEILIDKTHIDFDTQEIYKSIKTLLVKDKIGMKIHIY